MVTDRPSSSTTSRRYLRRSDDDVVVCDRISTPVVSDRDVRLGFVRSSREGALAVRFSSSSALAPPPDPSYVRLPVVRGEWAVAAAPGGARLTYSCYSEPGGSVPAFLIRGALKDRVVTDVERMLSFLRGG